MNDGIVDAGRGLCVGGVTLPFVFPPPSIDGSSHMDGLVFESLYIPLGRLGIDGYRDGKVTGKRPQLLS